MKINPIITNRGSNIVRHNIVPKSFKYAAIGMAAILAGCTHPLNKQDAIDSIRTEAVSSISNNKTVENKHLKAIKYTFEDYYQREGVKAYLKNDDVLEVDIPNANKESISEYLRFDLEKTKTGVQFRFNSLKSSYPGSPMMGRFINQINIENSDGTSPFKVTTTRYEFNKTSCGASPVYKTFEFDKDGNYITDAQRHQDRQAKIENKLTAIPFFANNDTKMLSSILASMGISSVDAIEQNNCIELFCNNDEASYYFVLKKGNDNSLYGIVNEMPVDGRQQTVEYDAPTAIYALKCSDKSTDNAKRMLVTTMRVVQNDVDNQENNTKKFGERTDEHHVVNNYKTARGFLGGAAIMATDENTFTTKYLSEGAVSTLYSIEQDGMIKRNGRNIY